MNTLIAFAPEWALVLGSGLKEAAEPLQIEGTLPFSEVPDMPAPSVPGHTGSFAWGTWGGRRVVVQRGRVHLYEGNTAQAATAGIRFLHRCGVRKLILTNAAGTCNEGFPPGSWMSLSDHLNLTGTSPLLGGPNFFEMGEVYSKKWREHFAQAAAAENVPLHAGVYAGLVGPQYETPAEVRMLRTIGADAVGMSTVLEAIQARALGMEVVGFSCLTNWAAGLNAEPLSHHEVLEMGKTAGADLGRVLTRALAATPAS